MQPEDFFRVMSLFVEPSDIIRQGQSFIVTVGGAPVSAHLRRSNYALEVVEDAMPGSLPAERWIVHRLGNIRSLAERVLSNVEDSGEWFVDPSATTSHDENSDHQGEDSVHDATDGLGRQLSLSLAGSTRVVYLTSDAGEGKTTLIERLSRESATRILADQGDPVSLVLPIALGGRPFLRFDDVVVATLVNRFRFHGIHYLSFIELVKLGAIIPAFDGFEEMFVESAAGEAVSALGSLIKDLKCDGTVLIAARKAYFEYHRLDSQVKLFDSIGGSSVSFSSVHLHRWDAQRFTAYGVARGYTHEESLQIYESIADVLSPDHPLLTRAVLVKRVYDIAEDISCLRSIVLRMENGPNGYFCEFVRGIIEREANEKWIDRSGPTHAPLLTVDQHENLLVAIAREMWVSRASSLSYEVLELIVQLTNESLGLPLTATRQCIQRIKDHALLRVDPSSSSRRQFDHEEFEQYFLGMAVAASFRTVKDSELRSVLACASLPKNAVVSCVQDLRSHAVDWTDARQRCHRLLEGESMTSFIRENAGAILVGLLDQQESGGELRGLTFPEGSLCGRHIRDTRFIDCTFQSTSLQGTRLEKVQFHGCDFEEIEIVNESCLTCDDVLLVGGTRVRALSKVGVDFFEYSPISIEAELYRIGWRRERESEVRDYPPSPDQRMILVRRLLGGFVRANELNERSMENRIGSGSHDFFSDILADLLKRGVLSEVQYSGRGRQRRYRINRRLSDLQDSIQASDGRYDVFLEKLGGD